MASFRQGRVLMITAESAGIVEAEVEVGTERVPAAGFPHMLGPLRAGDRVIVNMTGIDLALGTGGAGFILWNLDGAGITELSEGHIVKLRYTPWQTEVLAAEAPESPHHETLREADGVDGMPVVVAGLHSQVAGAAAGIKAARQEARVGYLMTDGAALPLAWSRLTGELRAAGLIDVTCSSGHAFGGELEAVNDFSGLAALRRVGGADIVVAAAGPGVVGTETKLGFSAMEQGQVLDVAAALGGRGIAALRISFAEERARHRGVSHHTLTALSIAARDACTIAVPHLPPAQAHMVDRQLGEAGLAARHDLVTAHGEPGLVLLDERGLRPSSMRRDLSEVPELFLAAAAAGNVAAGYLG